MAKVSVIIPCYNHGIYIKDTIDSVIAQSMNDYEIIVINDGSTDETTNSILSSLQGEKTRVLTTANQGLAAARNHGIAAAIGTYILPLDADDCIEPDYLKKAAAILDSDQTIGIVYCKAMLFGEVNCEWTLPEYRFEEMLKDNIIFCSALFRKSDWERVGGYDSGMVYGWEDYEFWLSIIALGRTVVRIDEHLSHYRVSSDSMVRTKEKWQKVEMFARIYRRHQDLFEPNIEIWLEELLEHREPYFQSKLYIDNGNGFCEKDSISRKVVAGTHRLHFDLASFNSIRQIRFDPLDRCCCISIQEIKALANKQAKLIDLQTVATNADYQKGQSLMFSDNDPNITIDGSVFANHTESLEITFTILSFGEQALRDIVRYGKKNPDTPQGSSGIFLKWFGLK